jgi:dTDP-4-amino-4,6-dideoxygalactose transaminase
VNDRTVGVIGVHLYGQPFDVESIQNFCSRHGLWLIEDAAQAHGAQWRGKSVGAFGHLSTWSFYPSKNLGCFGDGGAITGNDLDLLERARRLANHGRVDHYHHREVGTNSRLDGLQAAVLSCRLQLLQADNDNRRRIATVYRSRLTGISGLTLLGESSNSSSAHHQFTILTTQRDDLKEYLASCGVGSGIYYPTPLHLQPAFDQVASTSHPLPESEKAASEVLSLPMFPELEDSEVDYVCASVGEYFAQ